MRTGNGNGSAWALKAKERTKYMNNTEQIVPKYRWKNSKQTVKIAKRHAAVQRMMLLVRWVMWTPQQSTQKVAMMLAEGLFLKESWFCWIMCLLLMLWFNVCVRYNPHCFNGGWFHGNIIKWIELFNFIFDMCTQQLPNETQLAEKNCLHFHVFIQVIDVECCYIFTMEMKALYDSWWMIFNEIFGVKEWKVRPF